MGYKDNVRLCVTRHTPDCFQRDDRYWHRCRCPKWIRGILDGKQIRVTVKTRSWEKASFSNRAAINQHTENGRKL